MTIEALKQALAKKAAKKVATVRNGVGAFILPCTRMEFHYCDWGGSSRGMKSFLDHKLSTFAKAHPSIAITISPTPSRHPTIIGHYINGRHKAICVKNLEPNSILKKVELLRDSSGAKNSKLKQKVISQNESVRGIWSPLHGEGREAADAAGLSTPDQVLRF